jgi:threonine/homoserine/homoserine lactone efflux protein
VSVVELAGAAAAGLGLGVVTGIPPAVVNLSIMEAAAAGRVGFAVRVGIGGAIADTAHAGVAFVGVGGLVTEHPTWMKAMALIAAAVIASYVALAWRGKHAQRQLGQRTGVVIGLLLTLPNPAALGAWVAVAAALWPTVDLTGAIVLAVGVGIGSAVWFTALARWISRAPRVARVISRIGIVLLAAIAVLAVVRVFS